MLLGMSPVPNHSNMNHQKRAEFRYKVGYVITPADQSKNSPTTRRLFEVGNCVSRSVWTSDSTEALETETVQYYFISTKQYAD